MSEREIAPIQTKPVANGFEPAIITFAVNVRREGDRLMEQLAERLNTWRGKFEERVTGSLSHYFDPKQGLFVERVDRLTKADGELATVVRRQVKDAEQSLSKVFDQFLGENSTLLRG